jgi:hypothetical protein
VIVDKHEDVMAKYGAILAQGIIDAGEWISASVVYLSTTIWIVWFYVS